MLLVATVFLPLWAVLLGAVAVESAPMLRASRARTGRNVYRPYLRISRDLPAQWADDLVGLIARHKAIMLACSLGVLGLLAVGASVDFSLGKSSSLTDSVVQIGGYVAIVGLVLGLPALGYAMVTDRSAQQIWEALGVSKEEFMEIHTYLDAAVQRARTINPSLTLPPEHYLQVFAPNRDRTVLRPIYDPEGVGPEEGWGIKSDAPQGITGSAWVADALFFAKEDALKDPAFRLSPAQLRRYEQQTGVAAAPIRDPRTSAPIGVLTIVTRAATPEVATPETIRMQLELAKLLAKTVREHVPTRGALDQSSDREYDEVTPAEAGYRMSGSVRVS